MRLGSRWSMVVTTLAVWLAVVPFVFVTLTRGCTPTYLGLTRTAAAAQLTLPGHIPNTTHTLAVPSTAHV